MTGGSDFVSSGCTGLADKWERKDKSERSLYRAFLIRFQKIFLHSMKDRHHFYMHNKNFYQIWLKNSLNSDRSDLSFRSDLSARPVQVFKARKRYDTWK